MSCGRFFHKTLQKRTSSSVSTAGRSRKSLALAGGTVLAMGGYYYYSFETIIGNCRRGDLSKISQIFEEMPIDSNFDSILSSKDFLIKKTSAKGTDSAIGSYVC